MRIDIKATNIELNEALKEWVDNKIGSLEKFIKDDDREVMARVEIGKTTSHHYKGPFFKAECLLEISGKSFRAESQREDLRIAIVDVKDDLQEQLTGGKGKFISKLRRGQRKLKRLFSFTPETQSNEKGKRIRDEGR